MPLEAFSLPRPEVLVVLAAIGGGLLYAVVAAARRWVRRAQLRARFERASEGEREAAAILEAQGYAIEGAQVSTSYAVEVDGAPVEISLRADYVVVRGGERFVAEVKTGRLAPRVEAPATRRQLLEYHVAFGAAGVLLVDADARSIRRIAFPTALRARRTSSFFWALVLAAVVLAGLVALVTSTRG